MDDKVVIDCICPSVLTITISGAAHSVTIATDAIRISGPGGGVGYNLDSLPLIYDAATLGGKLNICDDDGKLVYCWRSSITPQSMPSASIQARADSSSSSSLGPAPRTEMTQPDSSLVSALAIQPRKRRSTSVRTDDTSCMSTAPSAATLSPSGNFGSDRSDAQHSIYDDTIEEARQKSEGPVNEELVVRFGRHLQELKRKHKWAKLREYTLCQQCGDAPNEPVVTNCLHVFCSECLTRLHFKLAEQDMDGVACPKCDETITETQPCKGLKELRQDALREAGHHVGRKDDRKIGKGYIDLEDEDTDPPASRFTVAQKEFLVKSINSLMRHRYGECFRNSLSPTSELMDLSTMRSKIQDGLYSSIEALRADFDRMEQTYPPGDAYHHRRTEQARSLRTVFETCMGEYPGNCEDLAPRKKAKARKPKAPSAGTTARAEASSRSRAAKTAMQGKRYPRDHW
ncbi:hypothetical protein HO173_009710 [Letharia columbiana]|uniref:RING-type domain-containing protein n=1 Tax=Letharia columbiana TaxID=112416 RepID=A0A8H6FP62_9LECA|nr:uncharacterized protein HO173_009710 [Letharia columbiana]KAF6232116.1 hypothetical protein HO173_009710 [Letharia columbiana]